MIIPSVIHVVPAPDHGGAERLVRELTHRLPTHGVEAQAIYYSNPRGVELSDRELNLGLRSVRGWSALRAVRDALQKQANDSSACIVHAHLTWPLYHLALLSREIDGPIAFTEHNTHNRRRRHWWLRPLERTVYRRYDQLIAISDGVQEALMEWLGDRDLSARIDTIYNGSRMLPLQHRRPRLAGVARLVSIGSLNSRKGFDVALRAIARLGNKVERYTILGEGPERERLERLVQELGLKDKVQLPGHCDEVAAYLYEADLGLIPSRWEGFGLVAVEALSTGLPLVASDVPGLRSIVAYCEAVVLAAPDNVTELQNRLRYAIDNMVRRDDVASAARARAEQYTIETMVARYADMYARLVAKTNRCQMR